MPLRPGWVVGPLNSGSTVSCNKVAVKDNGIENLLKKMYEIERVPSMFIVGEEILKTICSF